MSVKNGNEVRIEKVLNSAPHTVFRALSEGRLFNTCGADGEKLKIDFKVGGGYQIFFANADISGSGKFLEIIPDKKIVFTWGDEGSHEAFPKTQVLVELHAESGGTKTKLLIVHTGFKSKEDAESHDQGWSAGLNDLTNELVEGKLSILRIFPVSRDVLYSVCSDPRKFFAPVSKVDAGTVDFRVGGKYRFPTEKFEISGEFQEIIPGQKIVFSWLSGCEGKYDHPTRVTLSFDDEDDGASSLKIEHEALPLGDDVRNTRKGWEHLTTAIRGMLK